MSTAPHPTPYDPERPETRFGLETQLREGMPLDAVVRHQLADLVMVVGGLVEANHKNELNIESHASAFSAVIAYWLSLDAAYQGLFDRPESPRP